MGLGQALVGSLNRTRSRPRAPREEPAAVVSWSGAMVLLVPVGNHVRYTPPPHSYRLFKHRYAHTYISICTRTSKCMHMCICIPHTHTCSCVSAPRGVLILSKTAVSSRFKGSTGAGELYQALAVAQKPSFLCGYRCGWLSKLGSRFGYPK